jgi:hypothetical protein
MKLDEVISKYVQLRDKKAQLTKDLKEKIAPIDTAMEQIEAVLLKTFDQIGTESMKTGDGTAYISTKTSATVADKEAFGNFVRENPDHWPLADVRAAKAAIQQYVDEHQDLPPGINWHSERTINVRRS